MPTVKLLKTTVGGYEIFNLDSETLASFFSKVNLDDDVNDARTVFRVGGIGDPVVPYAASAYFFVFLRGILQPATQNDPSTGEFTLPTAPVAGDLPMDVYFIAA